MASLSNGFCTAALVGSFSTEEMARWKQLWPAPCLQIVDIQRYPRELTARSPKSCFYLAVSDSASLVWVLVPPGTPLEGMITHFQVDVGCCVTLHEYALVNASNGLNVVVALQAECSPNPLSLLGAPTYDTTLFCLSANGLTTQQSFLKASRVAQQPVTEITLSQLETTPECALNNWSVLLRVVWRGPARLLDGRSSADGSSTSLATNPRSRYMFHCVGVDSNGDAIQCIFWVTQPQLDTFSVGDCVHLGRGSVRWSETGQPLQLRFGDNSVMALGTPGESAVKTPAHPVRLVGTLSAGLSSVQTVVADAPFGEVVSIAGIVKSVQPSTYVNTRHGRVLRSGIIVEDTENGNIVLELTLWGELVELIVPTAGECWAFIGCSVREFMRRKTLSSRSVTIGVKVDRSPFLQLEQQQPSWNRHSHSEMDAPLHSSEPYFRGHYPAQFSLSLLEASATLPVLARIQSVELPVMVRQCAQCRQILSAQTDDHQARGCPHCGVKQCVLAFRATLYLSDGVDSTTARAYASAAESLFELKESDFEMRTLSDASFELRMCDQLIGAALLFWLARDSARGSCTVVNCRHVDYASVAKVLVDTIAQFTID